MGQLVSIAPYAVSVLVTVLVIDRLLRLVERRSAVAGSPYPQSSGTAAGTRRHFHELDLLRFLAAAAVVFFHLAAYSPRAGLVPMRFDGLYPVTKYGSLGVNLFFIISGFVIAITARGRTAGAFAFARGRRLYPAFWAACTVTCLVALLLGDRIGLTWKRYLVNMTLFAPYLGQESVDGVYWTLYAEIRFYALVALIVAVGQTRNLLVFMAVWTAASAVNLWFPIPRGPALLVLEYCPLFVAGAVYAEKARGAVVRWHHLLLAVAVALSVIYAVRNAVLQTITGEDHHPLVVGGIVLAFHATIAAVATGRLRVGRHPLLPVLGGVSYPLYLLHNEIGNALLRALPLPRYAALLLTVAAALSLAFLVHFVVERALARRRGPVPIS